MNIYKIADCRIGVEKVLHLWSSKMDIDVVDPPPHFLS